MKSDILLLTPPLIQPNTPYPATPYLKGFLNTKNISSYQCDLSIETLLFLFSKEGLASMFSFVENTKKSFSENSERILSLKNDYITTIDQVIVFLQGGNQNLAPLICGDNFLPQASRFESLQDLEWVFGTLGIRDKARHLATLYIEDICDFITECVDTKFGFSRYAESLGRCASSFNDIYKELHNNTFIDNITLSLLDKYIKECDPGFVCITIPFPGNLYSGLKCGKYIKDNYKDIKVEIGGGFVNTELRSITDVRIFEFTDYITIDDGEVPLMQIINHSADKNLFVRTFIKENNEVVYCNNEKIAGNLPMDQIGTPDYSDLQLNKYISLIDVLNPMHKLWSDGRWNKLTLAHGCYWGKCSFCDCSLDYIKRYEPVSIKTTVDRIEQIIKQTGEYGFHFVDEAAPPIILKELAIELLRRNLNIVWWTNVRFEKSYTDDLCRLLKASGCIAVAGGLEVASNRLLKLINKGVDVEQVARVASSFSNSGILVHAYLMYGFPTQTEQETIDSLEVVRQLFENKVIQSGFWHRFALTAHSPVSLNPEKFNIKPKKFDFGGFADNDRFFNDPSGTEHELYSDGLRKSIFNFMHEIGIDFPLRDWFEFKVPKTSLSPNLIRKALNKRESFDRLLNKEIIWTGGKIDFILSDNNKFGTLIINNRNEFVEVTYKKDVAEIIVRMLEWCSVRGNISELNSNGERAKYRLSDLKNEIEPYISTSFEQFCAEESMQDLFQTSLLLI